jgi:hypothetical protein
MIILFIKKARCMYATGFFYENIYCCEISLPD